MVYVFFVMNEFPRNAIRLGKFGALGSKENEKVKHVPFWGGGVHSSLSSILADISVDNLFIICDEQSHRYNGNPQSLLK